MFGTIEDGLNDLSTYIGDMQIDLTEGGCWTKDPEGQDGQRRFVEAFCAFQDPRLRRHYLFTYNDLCCSPDDLDGGKDFGLEDLHGVAKPAAAAFNGGLDL